MKQTISGLFIVLFLTFVVCGHALGAPLADGLYLYNYQRISDFPEMAAQYEAMGMAGGVKTIENYKDVVVEVRNGRFTDPIVQIELLTDRNGLIRCADNPTVQGQFNRNGDIRWVGSRDHFGTQVDMVTTGTLVLVTSDMRAGSEFNGVYILEEDVMDRRMVATIDDGFLTLLPVSLEEWELETGYVGYPSLVKPDGSFTTELEFTTRTEMYYAVDAEGKDIQSVIADSSSFVTREGYVTPSGFYLTYYNSTGSSIDSSAEESPRVFGGLKLADTHIRELIDGMPEDRRLTASDIDLAGLDDLPDWYIMPPLSEIYYYSTGFKKQSDRRAALTAAETTAAASLALQLQAKIKSLFLLYSEEHSGGGHSREWETYLSKTDQIAYLSFNYEVAESVYDENSQSAYVLVRAEKSDIINSLLDLFVDDEQSESDLEDLLNNLE